MREGIALTDDDREAWLAALRQLIDRLLHDQQSAIIACSALKHAYRERLQGAESAVQFVYLKGSYELIHDRLRNRQGHFMSADLLKSQFETLEKPENVLTVDIAQEPAMIIGLIKSVFTLVFVRTKVLC
jgi:gluconokinase